MAINKKPYLSILLLFLLLVDKSLSVRVSPSLVKEIFKEISGQVIEYTWKKSMDKLEKEHQGKQIPGLAGIKEYFYNFGYLQDSGPFNNSLDDDTISAVKSYQQYFNLQVTGELNKETIQHISLPRCGVPDRNFEYGFNTAKLSWPKGTQWFPTGTKNLTYSFHPESKIPSNMTKVISNAFKRWSLTTRVVNLTETAYDDADIKVGFYDLGEGVEDAVVGDTIISLQTDSDVKTGEIRLDSKRYWELPNYNGTLSFDKGIVDLETVAMHQIGHLLGLGHFSNNDSIMYPTILPSKQRKVQITNSENETIQNLYTNGNYGDGGRFTLFLRTLSVGFACMALLH